MTDASKKTLSLGHVHGLSGGSKSSLHMFSMEVNSHQATVTLMVPARMVPMNYTKAKTNTEEVSVSGLSSYHGK